MKILRLDNNKLKDINGLLQSQTELQNLNVSSNRLQWFDYAFIPKVNFVTGFFICWFIFSLSKIVYKVSFNFQSLEMIDLHDNQIEELGNYFVLKVKGS